jgi:HD superfamily phosphohydrolase
LPSDPQLEVVIGAPDEEERRSLNLKVGQKLDEIYTILDKLKPDEVPEAESDKLAKSLGEGGSSTVYLASYRGMQKRAIKFLTLNKLSDSSGKHPTDFQTTFNRERVFLAELSHGNIARFYDTGVHTDAAKKDWPYVVIDYIDGEELLPTLEQEDTTPEQAYEVVSDVFRAVVHMHGRHVLHADIKWQNIKCRKSASGLEAVILDLGTAHHIPPNKQGQGGFQFDKEARVKFICTAHICHDRHNKYRNHTVNEHDLRVLFPSHDIHSLGVLLDELRKNKKISQKFRHVIGAEGLITLDTMIYNILKSPEPEPNREEVRELKRARQYESVYQVYQDWQKLRRTYLAPAGVPELSLAAEFKYAIATSAGRIVVTPRLSSIVNHKLFQRLRRVPQLEMKLISFPGATHTRYAHSMAVLRNTRYYLAHLLNDPNFRLLTERADLEATLLLSLLHDVGHYQLSHMFEDFAVSQREAKTENPWNKIDFDIPSDDDLFQYIINPAEDDGLKGEYGRTVRAAWNDSVEKLGLSKESSRRRHREEDEEEPEPEWLANIICDEFGDETYAAMLDIHKAIYQPKDADESPRPEINPAHLVLGAVLSSDIDADKVAYLVEDSARTGIKYGAAVDFDGLLGALRMPAIDDINGQPTLGITRKGVAAAQSIAVGRNLMFGQVYLRHTDRAVTAMIKYPIARMLEEGLLSVPDYIRHTLFKEYEASLEYLFTKFAQLETVRKGEEVNTIAGLLEGERRIYKTAFSTSRLDSDKAQDIGDKLAGKSFDNIIKLEENLRKVVSEASDVTDIKPGEVLVDVPIKDRGRAAGERGGQVFVYSTTSDTKGTRLRNYTPFLRAINEQHRRENRVSRVFVAPRIAEGGSYEAVLSKVRGYIENMYGE